MASVLPSPAPARDPAVPGHIAIIMDGNGRWAKARNLPRSAGHRKGAEAVSEAIEGALELGLDYLTIFAFSTENWGRPEAEVNDLMGLLRLYLRREIKRLLSEGVRLRVIGSREGLASDIVEMIEDAEQASKANQRLTLIIALNYGARGEILGAVKTLAGRIEKGELHVDDIDEDCFSGALLTKDIPDPDLVIRTSGEYRLSNFLLWQASYAELMFMDIYWPDFTKETLRQAVSDFADRDRRFGRRSAG